MEWAITVDLCTNWCIYALSAFHTQCFFHFHILHFLPLHAEWFRTFLFPNFVSPIFSVPIWLVVYITNWLCGNKNKDVILMIGHWMTKWNILALTFASVKSFSNVVPLNITLVHDIRWIGSLYQQTKCCLPTTIDLCWRCYVAKSRFGERRTLNYLFTFNSTVMGRNMFDGWHDQLFVLQLQTVCQAIGIATLLPATINEDDWSLWRVSADHEQCRC